MSRFLILHSNIVFMVYMVIGVGLLVAFETTFNGGFFLSVKVLSAPVACLVLLFVKRKMAELRRLKYWSNFKVWAFAYLVVYPVVLLMAWPYFVSVNALLSNKEIVKVGGVITGKFTTNGKYGEGFHVTVRNVDSEKEVELTVRPSEYSSLQPGQVYYHNFYKGAFGVPWHGRGRQP